ncbi:MAG: hypothetical protein ACLS95_07285 [Clostridia bacterium]
MKQRGITLIALVITIIVLIILAGVAINALVGENGIIKQAQKAQKDTLNATTETEEKMNVLVDEINKQIAGEEIDKPYVAPTTVEEAKNRGVYVQGNTQINDNKSNRVIIPDGFKIATDSGISVSEGIVIEDKDLSIDGNGENRGNQFVWVPVGNIIKADGTQTTITLGRYTFAADGTETLVQNANNYEQEVSIESYFKELLQARISNNSTGTDATNTTAKNLKGFIDSVKINGGYYIARYEASYKDGVKPNTKVSKVSTEETNYLEGKLWNHISEPEAANVSRNMYNSLRFETDLVNSYAWDTTISFIQKCSNDKGYSRQSALNTTIANTGKNEDEKCKINDMASNMAEWTTEYVTYKNATLANPCALRGGNYFDKNSFSVYRIGYGAADTNFFIGFRVLLYLNV